MRVNPGLVPRKRWPCDNPVASDHLSRHEILRRSPQGPLVSYTTAMATRRAVAATGCDK
jgi:hypothetical protein